MHDMKDLKLKLLYTLLCSKFTIERDDLVGDLNAVLSQLRLCQAVFLLERFRHLGRWRTGHAQIDLDGVIDEPLCRSQSTDHDDSWSQTLPYATETKLFQDVTRGCSLLLIQLWHHLWPDIYIILYSFKMLEIFIEAIVCKLCICTYIVHFMAKYKSIYLYHIS